MVDLLQIIRCPVCGERLVQNASTVACLGCTSEYPLVEGTPILHRERRPDTAYTDDSPPRSRLRSVVSALGLEPIARSVYRDLASWQTRLAPKSPALPQYWIDRFHRALPDIPRRRVLDFGGGTGTSKQWLARSDDDYVILEVDRHWLQRSGAWNQHRYVIGDGHDDLFAPGSFDVIGMFEVLEHVRNPFRVMANCARWLAPGGVLVLSTPQYWHVHGWPSDYFRYTSHGLRMLANESGLVVDDVWAMGGPCVLMWCVLDLNFSRLFRAPLVMQTVSHPLLVGARVADKLLFSDNERRRNPDTRGWMMVARKATSEERADGGAHAQGRRSAA